MKTKLLLIILIFMLAEFSTGFLVKDTYAQTWSTVGSGVGDDIHALAVYNGELYAGGWFSTAGGNPANAIAKWDGTNWSAVGTGINDHIHTLAVYNGELYAGGHFTAAGGNTANYIAKWNGTNWSEVGTGMNEHVYSLAVYNGELYASGDFTTAGGNPVNHIAKWDGTNWSSLGAMNFYFNQLVVYNGELYAGGTFGAAGGNIAKWDGTTWAVVGGGVNSTTTPPVVNTLAVYGAELYIAGTFSTAGGNPANNIAKWDGISWSAVGTGVNNSSGPIYVFASGVYNAELYVGGFFTTAGGNSANNIAKWNGTNWSALGAGVNASVWAIAVYNTELYVGGFFGTAGGNPANYIAKWNSGTTGIEDTLISQKSTTVFPNPSMGVFSVLNSGSEIEHLMITNLLGETIYKSELRGEKIEIDLSDQTKGIYFIRLIPSSGENCDEAIVQKIIIQ